MSIVPVQLGERKQNIDNKSLNRLSILSVCLIASIVIVMPCDTLIHTERKNSGSLGYYHRAVRRNSFDIVESFGDNFSNGCP